jgi:uncharacterized protein (TIGR03546 family)
MLLTRKIGSFLRGNATPGQVFTAAMLASLLGFIPGFVLPGDLGGGFMQAPGLILSLMFLVLVLNANLGVFGLVTLVAKLVSFATLPLASAIGDFLLNGPLQGLAKTLVNAPVTAWFGLHYYATAGGLVLGLVFGLVAGIVFVKSLTTFRTRMAAMEQAGGALVKVSQSRWMRLITWLLLGKRKTGGLSYQELVEGQKKALPVRIGGIVVVAILCASLWIFQSWFSKPILTGNVRSGLMAVNGATVDLGSAELDLAGGSLKLSNLAIADASALDKNLFSAGALEATIDTGALLRRRFVIDRLHSASARSGDARAIPGQLVEKKAPPPPPKPTEGTKTIDDYLKDAEVWKQRLEQAREWIEKLTARPAQPPSQETKEATKKQHEIDIATLGHARAAANHLIEGVPSLVIRSIDLEGIACDQLGDNADLKISNFSSNAWLMPEPPKFALKTKKGDLAVEFTGPSGAMPGAGIALSLKGLQVDSLFAKIKTSGEPPVRGGTYDIEVAKGSLMTHPGEVTTCELATNVTLKGVTFLIPGSNVTKVDNMTLPLAISGPVTRPNVGIQDKDLSEALMKAGKQELANFVKSKAGKFFNEHGIPGAVGEILDPTKSPSEMVDAAKKKAEEEAAALQKKAEEEKAALQKKTEEEAKKAASDLLKGGKPDATGAKDLQDAAKKGLKGLIPGGGKKQ